MILKLFGVMDSVENAICDFSPAINAAAFIRAKLPNLVSRYALNDLTLYEVGELETEDCSLTVYSEKIPHKWNEYKFPENRAEALSQLEIEEITHKKEVK